MSFAFFDGNFHSEMTAFNKTMAATAHDVVIKFFRRAEILLCSSQSSSWMEEVGTQNLIIMLRESYRFV